MKTPMVYMAYSLIVVDSDNVSLFCIVVSSPPLIESDEIYPVCVFNISLNGPSLARVEPGHDFGVSLLHSHQGSAVVLDKSVDVGNGVPIGSDLVSVELLQNVADNIGPEVVDAPHDQAVENVGVGHGSDGLHVAQELRHLPDGRASGRNVVVSHEVG